MRTTHRIVSSSGAALLGSLALTAPAQAEPVSVRSIPFYCTPGSDSSYFGAHCQTQRVYHVKAYCDHSDGRSKVLRGERRQQQRMVHHSLQHPRLWMALPRGQRNRQRELGSVFKRILPKAGTTRV